MRIVDLALKDLKQLTRDWKTALFLIVMPIAFTLLFGFIFGGAGSGDEDPRLPVGYLDLDGGAVSASLLDLLFDSDAIRPVDIAAGAPAAGEPAGEEAAARVASGELAALVVVPVGYGAQALDVARDEAPALRFVAEVDGNAGRTAQNAVEAAVGRLMGAAEAARLSAQAYEAQGGTPGALFVEQAFARAMTGWDKPPLGVDMRVSGAVAATEGKGEVEASPYAHSSAGIMVQFAMAGLLGAAGIILVERKSGSLKRLLTTPISRPQILAGHSLAMFVMIFFQLVLLIAFGQLVLGVDYLRGPESTLVMAIVTALWAASLGLLIGIVARTEEQAIMATVVTMLVLSGLGGAWMPLEFTGETFQAVGYLTPVAWAIEGFENVAIRGLGFESVRLPALILVGYAVVLYAVAGWRFRIE